MTIVENWLSQKIPWQIRQSVFTTKVVPRRVLLGPAPVPALPRNPLQARQLKMPASASSEKKAVKRMQLVEIGSRRATNVVCLTHCFLFPNFAPSPVKHKLCCKPLVICFCSSFLDCLQLCRSNFFLALSFSVTCEFFSHRISFHNLKIFLK